MKVEVEAMDLSFAALSRLKAHLAAVEHVKEVRIMEQDASGISVLMIRGLINNEVIAKAILKLPDPKLEPELPGPGRVGVGKKTTAGG
ncbi:MAG: hypothetical protein KGY99_09965 [Phycisphaerae bacterium]|nr:hypothetical protein [Phycisphaerae bacterium]